MTADHPGLVIHLPIPVTEASTNTLSDEDWKAWYLGQLARRYRPKVVSNPDGTMTLTLTLDDHSL